MLHSVFRHWNYANVNLASLLAPYVQHIFGFLSSVNADINKTEGLMRSGMGVLG